PVGGAVPVPARGDRAELRRRPVDRLPWGEVPEPARADLGDQPHLRIVDRAELGGGGGAGRRVLLVGGGLGRRRRRRQFRRRRGWRRGRPLVRPSPRAVSHFGRTLRPIPAALQWRGYQGVNGRIPASNRGGIRRKSPPR